MVLVKRKFPMIIYLTIGIFKIITVFNRHRHAYTYTTLFILENMTFTGINLTV